MCKRLQFLFGEVARGTHISLGARRFPLSSLLGFQFAAREIFLLLKTALQGEVTGLVTWRPR